MAYPPQQSTVVITQQPTVSMPMKRPWGSGLGACFNDTGICLPATFIPQCYQCAVMADFDEDCCVAWPCCLGPNMTLLALRYHFRNKHNIQGSLMNDCCAAMFCYQCALCQLMREHKNMKYQVPSPIPINPVVMVQSSVPQMAPLVTQPGVELTGYDQ
ncbi:hypothetical protein NP493_23g00009 [Ridgeia piscesae]|uniref:Cornifelin n=1 Tax=Ridgeia piscesae TaxID=27915 RepID=A0AAD9PDV8_RIDPI|nr:hypothetical protein NP493_23g00009 [Ridgeia piscesae]